MEKFVLPCMSVSVMHVSLYLSICRTLTPQNVTGSTALNKNGLCKREMVVNERKQLAGRFGD